MGALSGLISLISNFIKLLVTGVESVISFGRMAFDYLTLFVSFIPVQFAALFMVVLIAALIYLILGR